MVQLFDVLKGLGSKLKSMVKFIRYLMLLRNMELHCWIQGKLNDEYGDKVRPHQFFGKEIELTENVKNEIPKTYLTSGRPQEVHVVLLSSTCPHEHFILWNKSPSTALSLLDMTDTVARVEKVYGSKFKMGVSQ